MKYRNKDEQINALEAEVEKLEAMKSYEDVIDAVAYRGWVNGSKVHEDAFFAIAQTYDKSRAEVWNDIKGIMKRMNKKKKTGVKDSHAERCPLSGCQGRE